jgi:hypothetical protein
MSAGKQTLGLTSVLLAMAAFACGDSSDDETQSSTSTASTTTSESSSHQTADSNASTTSTSEENCTVAGDAESLDLAGPCASASRLGGFRIEEQTLFSIMAGEVADGVPPLSILQDVATYGACKILRRPNLVCDPPCNADETCNLEEMCVPYPRNQDLGVVEVDGLNKCLNLSAAAVGKKYTDNDLPHPVFEPGALVELRTPPGAFGPLLLHGQGVEALELAAGDWRVLAGQATLVRWTAPTMKTRAWIDLRINVDQHGLSPASLYCTVEDTGWFEIPAEAIDALYDLGVSGAPSGSLTRRSVDSQQVNGGCVDLSVGSSRTPSICIREADCK